ncbi:glutaredoxin family protein [Candidatus Nitrotoga sp. 1052]|uniref:glutaredoxin family protein n=1 Tax=Candidatus Nitrotoga sp. 1052 TaxID=2886964 RepID=UPI001EF60A9B|nr:glutaredoxin family protein [Candidatus Nitrotoga sp. 1052]CAH1083607.1 Glutaredoxin [Candidatus Nitrotoga sp. 1052]
MRRRFLWAGLIALMCGSAQADGLYRWVDKSGKVHYGDAPAADAAKVEQKKFGAAPTVDVNDLPYATRRAKQNFPVTLYIAENCGDPCKQAREFLNKRGIPFTENNVRTKEELDAFKKLSGSEGVPTLAVGKTWFKGFQAEQWGGGLDTAGYSQTSSHQPQPPAKPSAAQPAKTETQH